MTCGSVTLLEGPTFVPEILKIPNGVWYHHLDAIIKVFDFIVPLLGHGGIK